MIQNTQVIIIVRGLYHMLIQSSVKIENFVRPPVDTVKTNLIKQLLDFFPHYGFSPRASDNHYFIFFSK